jgi:hypothetical protein
MTIAIDRNNPGWLIKAGDLSGHIEGKWYETMNADKASVTLTIASGDAAGVFYFYQCNAVTEDPDAMSVPTVTKVASSALNKTVPIDIYGRFIRCEYTRSSGGAAQTCGVSISLKLKS